MTTGALAEPIGGFPAFWLLQPGQTGLICLPRPQYSVRHEHVCAECEQEGPAGGRSSMIPERFSDHGSGFEQFSEIMSTFAKWIGALLRDSEGRFR